MIQPNSCSEGNISATARSITYSEHKKTISSRICFGEQVLSTYYYIANLYDSAMAFQSQNDFSFHIKVKWHQIHFNLHLFLNGIF